MLKTAHLRIFLLIILATAIPAVGFSLDSATRVWTFDDDPLEGPSSEFPGGVPPVLAQWAAAGQR